MIPIAFHIFSQTVIHHSFSDLDHRREPQNQAKGGPALCGLCSLLTYSRKYPCVSRTPPNAAEHPTTYSLPVRSSYLCCGNKYLHCSDTACLQPTQPYSDLELIQGTVFYSGQRFLSSRNKTRKDARQLDTRVFICLGWLCDISSATTGEWCFTSANDSCLKDEKVVEDKKSSLGQDL